MLGTIIEMWDILNKKDACGLRVVSEWYNRKLDRDTVMLVYGHHGVNDQGASEAILMKSSALFSLPIERMAFQSSAKVR